MLNTAQIIGLLESEWEVDTGFFWRIRQGTFDPADFERALGKVQSISIVEDAAIPRRIVSLLWFIPLFMEWQVERVRESGGDMVLYARAQGLMQTEIQRLLGLP